MSKRKHSEGGRVEEPVGGAPKRVRTGHSESPGAQANIDGQSVPENNTEDAFSAIEAAKLAGKLAKRERRKAEKEERAKNNESAQSESKGRKDKKKKQSRANSGWRMSDVVGGCLVDGDPVFSADEQ